MTTVKRFVWYGPWREAILTCPACGWNGRLGDLDKRDFREFCDVQCPQCRTELAVIDYPTHAEIRAAAAAGNPEAIGELPRIEEREARCQRFERDKLKSPDQLPSLRGDKLVFVLDTIREQGGDTYNVVKCNSRTIWTELAQWEGYRRYGELRDILRRKYGSRFAGLKATAYAFMYLMGDYSVTPEHIQVDLVEAE